jgi:hypothetical protein
MVEIIIIVGLVSGTISLVSFGKAAQQTVILFKRPH